MDLKKYLTQVQDFATDLVSRNNLLNDLYQEVIEMMLHDDKEPPKEAIVLKVLPNTQTADELKEGKEQYYTAVLRIPKLHDCLPDPARKIKNSTNGELNKIIQCHTVCFSREKLSSVDGSGNPPVAPQVGDRVMLDFVDGIPRFGVSVGQHPDYTGLQFLSEKSEDQSSGFENKSSTAKAFERAKITPLEDLMGKSGKDISDASIEAASKNPGLAGQKITNGKLPEGALSPVPGKKDKYGRDIMVLTEVADDLLALMSDFKDHFGFEMSVGSHYRTYEGQVATKKRWTKKGKPYYAATPGTSKHGWGLAIDIDTGYPTEVKNFKYTKKKPNSSGFSSEIYKWMFANAPKRGWHSPSWAQEGGKPAEPWHFEVIRVDDYIKVFNGIESEQAE